MEAEDVEAEDLEAEDWRRRRRNQRPAMRNEVACTCKYVYV